MSQRVGVLGGTFDPVHNGHLFLATEVLNRCALDTVILVPTGDSYHRDVSANAHQRLAMVERAVAGIKNLAVSDVDVRRPGPTYTVDTLRDLGALLPQSELAFIVGTDSFETFEQWKDHDVLLEMAKIIVVARPGFDSQQTLANPQYRGRVEWVEISALDISSTTCRALVRDGKSLSGYVPESVEQYITEQNLYRR